MSAVASSGWTAPGARRAADGGFYRGVRLPSLLRGLRVGDANGESLPPARPRRAAHPLPPDGGRSAGRGDRRPARSASLDGLPRARAQPLPRRRPRLLRLLPPDRPRSGPPASAATWEAGSRRRPAGARGRAARGRLVAAADRRAAPARGGRGARRLPRDDLPPRLRPGGPPG